MSADEVVMEVARQLDEVRCWGCGCSGDDRAHHPCGVGTVCRHAEPTAALSAREVDER